MILAGDETALPAIARIAAEVPAGTRLTIFLEVADASEEQVLVSAGQLDVRWLHRNGAEAGTTGALADSVKEALERASADVFVWAGCERSEARDLRDFLKARGHDRQRMSVGAYWQRTNSSPGEE
jgi:NADPH-dependent ferric siderophore reductase